MIDRRPPQAVVAPMPDCWRVIGVGGDRSCPELEQFIHCRNCPVLADAARTFFDRAAPAGYLESWHDILAEPAQAADTEATSLLVERFLDHVRHERGLAANTQAAYERIYRGVLAGRTV